MRDNFRYYVQDNLIKFSFSSSLVLIFLNTILIVWLQGKLPPYVPLFNSMPWGEGRLFSSRIILLFPLFLAVVLSLNNLLGTVFYKKYTLIARLLSFNAFLFIVLGFLAYLQIVFLVF